MYSLTPEQLLKQYEKAIHKAAHEFHRLSANNPRISYDDIVGEANVITMRAAQTYDETKGASFLTHLTNALERELRKYLIDNGYDLSVSEYTEREEYKNMGNLDRLREEANAQISLDSSHDYDGGLFGAEQNKDMTYGEILPSGYPSPEEVLIKNESLDILREELDALPERERHVINLRWFENKTLREIAEELNVSKQTIHGWEKAGIGRLEKRLKLRYGNDY
jgi:RNA polymerase sigma factor (sigma-70 family)